MASQIMNEIGRNVNMLPDLQIVSYSLDRKMSLEGFDLMRKLTLTAIPLQETCTSLLNTPPMAEKRIYGSIGEGLIYPLKMPCDRDIDLVCILANNIAIENVHETHGYGSETRTYLIENVALRPGFCYLRVVNEGSLFTFPNTIVSLTEEYNGYHYFSSLALNKLNKSTMNILQYPISCINNIRDFCDNPNLDLGTMDQQGPATNFHFKAQMQSLNIILSITKLDFVNVVHCPKWPSCAFHWLKRRSPSGWPCQELKKEIVKEGIFLAPVGCKQDPYQGIQWRYSFNEAERRLVRLFNPTQAKCYVLLKRIVSTYVTPWFSEDVLTSYILKTIMFWTIEETDLQVWIPANLVECIFLVLERLAQCVREETCPSYFITSENLFLERATLENKENVLARLNYILSEGFLLLFTLPNFSMECDLMSTITQEFWTEWNELHQHLLNSVECYQLASSCTEIFVLRRYLAELDIYEIHEASGIQSKLTEKINYLMLKVYACHDERINEVLKNVIAGMCSSYGTHCLSLARLPAAQMSTNIRADDVFGEIYMELSCWRNQEDCLAKYANYAYMKGNFQFTVSIAYNLLQRYLPHLKKELHSDVPINIQMIHLLSQTNDHVRDVIEDESSILTYLSDYLINLRISRDVIFLKNEIYAVPGNVKVEMFKVGRQDDFLNPLSKFRTHLMIDPYLYVTFLAFQTYCDMGNQEAANTAIQAMEIICSVPPNSHLPTSLNLLGDCYLKAGQIEKAMAKFILSMKMKNWRNAAPWHVARLVWRKLLDRWSETHDGHVG